jgi:hypothetical protein
VKIETDLPEDVANALKQILPPKGIQLLTIENQPVANIDHALVVKTIVVTFLVANRISFKNAVRWIKTAAAFLQKTVQNTGKKEISIKVSKLKYDAKKEIIYFWTYRIPRL